VSAVTGYDVLVRLDPDGVDDEERILLTRRLSAELLGLDVRSVGPVADDALPDGAKAGSAITGVLGLRLGAAALGAIVRKVRDWAGRSVELTIGGDTLKVTGVSVETQDRLIEHWLTRHAPVS
jgi:hypothetical protein